MEYPQGFENLVKLAQKSPVKKLNGKAIWDKFCEAGLIGKDRGEHEIAFVKNLLKDFLEYDFVGKTNEFGWNDKVDEFLKERMGKIRDEESKSIISNVLRDLTYISSNIKEGRNFFEQCKILEHIDKITASKESTEALIKDIAEDKSIPGMGYVKTILWLHYTGRAREFAPPTRHLKTFLNNDVGPYYQYYEDDGYFMKKAQEMALDFKKTSLMDIYRAVYVFRIFKLAMPRGSKFKPKSIVTYMKKKKMSFGKMEEMLRNSEKRDKIFQEVYEMAK